MIVKKTLAIGTAIATMMSVSLLAGCGSAERESNANNEEENVAIVANNISQSENSTNTELSIADIMIDTPESTETPDGYISDIEAADIAIKADGVAISDLFSGITSTLVSEEGKPDYYRVEFYYENKECEYDVDAITGEVIDSSFSQRWADVSRD